jgi:hypothetical protein
MEELARWEMAASDWRTLVHDLEKEKRENCFFPPDALKL